MSSAAESSFSQVFAASPSPLIPLTAFTHEYRCQSTQLPMNPMDESFGYTLSMTSTSESRHDRRLPLDSDVAPPPYAEPPAYEQRQSDPVTLAMYLFKFGFLFPPFWIMGAFILRSPLHAPDASSSSLPDAWLPEKTEAERQHIIAQLRKTEVKWARRCLVALIVLVLLGAAVGIAAWGVLRS